MATSAAIPRIMEETNNSSRERFLLLSRQAISNVQPMFSPFRFFILIIVSILPNLKNKEPRSKIQKRKTKEEKIKTIQIILNK